MIKRLFALSACLFFLTAAALAAPIYEYAETQTALRGVTLTNIRRFYANKSLNINCVEADLSQEYLSLELLKGAGVDSLETMDKLAASNENTVFAMNADFFSVYSSSARKGFSLGLEVSGGRLQKTQVDSGTMAAGFYDGSSLALSYLDLHMMAVAPNGEYTEIRHLNTHTNYYGNILMYTSDWNGGLSPAPGGDVAEIVVEDDRIVEFRRNQPAVEIPKNGYVFVVSEGYSMFFANNFQVGDPVRIDVYATPSLENIKTAFGGGTLLVKDGAKAPVTHAVSGNNPRSAIGVDASGQKLYMVTVDGRQTASGGATLDELSQIMLDLGCYNAVNLDGGGSTRMVGKTLWNSAMRVINLPTENRRVINAVGIVANFEKTDTPAGLQLKAEKPQVFTGDTARISHRLYDEYKSPVWVEEEPVKWSVSGVKGSCEDGVFRPASAGTAVITAKYKGISASVKVEVLSGAMKVELADEIICSKNGTRDLDIYAVDRQGRRAKIDDVSILNIALDSAVAVVQKDGTLYGAGAGQTVMSVSLDGATSYALVSVGNISENAVYDDFEAQTASYSPYPDYVGGSYAISRNAARSGNYSGKLTFDFTSDAQESKMASVLFDGSGKGIGDNLDTVSLWVNAEGEYGHMLRALFYDGNNEPVRIDIAPTINWTGWKEFTFKIPADTVRPVRLTKLYVVQTDYALANSGAVYFDDLMISGATAQAPTQAAGAAPLIPDDILDDPLNNGGAAKERGAFEFRIAAVPEKADTFVNAVAVSFASKAVKADASALVGKMQSPYAPASGTQLPMLTQKYDCFQAGDALVVTLDASGGGLRATSAAQWTNLDAAFQNTPLKNVFVLISGFENWNDSFEQQVFYDYIGAQAETKNVFVIYNGSANDITMRGKARYFSLADIADRPEKGISERVWDMEYLSFMIKGDSVTYSVKKMF